MRPLLYAVARPAAAVDERCNKQITKFKLLTRASARKYAPRPRRDRRVRTHANTHHNAHTELANWEVLSGRQQRRTLTNSIVFI